MCRSWFGDSGHLQSHATRGSSSLDRKKDKLRNEKKKKQQKKKKKKIPKMKFATIFLPLTVN